MQPPVVGSSMLHDSSLNWPSGPRGAGRAVGEFALTNPPVSLKPPTSASAFSASRFCLAITACAFAAVATSASIAALADAARSRRLGERAQPLGVDLVPLLQRHRAVQEDLRREAVEQGRRRGQPAGPVRLGGDLADLGLQHVDAGLGRVHLEGQPQLGLSRLLQRGPGLEVLLAGDREHVAQQRRFVFRGWFGRGCRRSAVSRRAVRRIPPARPRTTADRMPSFPFHVLPSAADRVS